MKTPTRFVSPLTAEERENLITAFKTHSSHPVRVRAHAVLLSERRFPIDEIAEIFDVHRNTVTEWLDRWKEDRSVDDHPGRGRKPTFDDEEQKEDVFIACVDGLQGFPEAIESIFPRAQVQLCIVHLLRNSVGYVSWKERKAVAAALKPIYTAAAEQVEQELTEFEAQ
jgi:mutator family transposase/Homeodomain-like domain-containing protein